MPEEINRLIADSCSALYFVPTDKTAINLVNEGVDHKNIYITGNTIVDACKRNIDIAKEKSTILDDVIFDEYITLTLHRAENVDDPNRLANIINSLINLRYNIVLPLHPHTRKSLDAINLYDELASCEHIQIMEPLGYLDFLALISNTKLILTDSGGLQEEAITLDIPCVTLRYNTERPETIDAGGNILAGTNSTEITNNIQNILDNSDVYAKMAGAINPYGDGTSAEKIYNIIKEHYDLNSLKIEAASEVVDFEGYELISINDDITTSEFEDLYPGCIIQQVFSGSKQVYLGVDDNLNGMNVIVKKFKIN